MLIAKSAVEQYLGRRFDSYLWMKDLTREQLERELRALPVRPRFKTDPWLHQLVCFYIGLMVPDFLFLLDMGLGKTKIILDLLTQLLRERRVRRGLVFVPRMINMHDWSTAAQVHGNLEPWLVDVHDTQEKFERLLHPKGDFTVIDYAGLHLACTVKAKGRKGRKSGMRLVPDVDKINALKEVYDFINPDECHKLGNPDSLWFRIADELLASARYRFGTTGTLFGRDLDAVHTQFNAIDRGATFGGKIALFHAAFFTAKQGPFRTELQFNRDMTPHLRRMLANRSIRYDDWEVNDLPKLVEQRRLFDLPQQQLEHYLRALEGLIEANGVLRDMEAQWFRMRQITAGYLQWKDDTGVHEVVFDKNPKLAALESMLVDELPDRKVVVSYEYTRTGQTIVDMLERARIPYVWLYGGTRDPIACKQRFIDDPACRVFLMNSEAGGTGVDGLQHVSNYLVMYESPSPPSPRKQVLKRVYRPGQKRRTFVIDMVMQRTVDAGILNALADDFDLYDRVVSGKVNPRSLFG